MLAGFYVFHKQGSSVSETAPLGAQAYPFKTCLRQIYFAWLDESAHVDIHGDFEIFRGKKAYQFALEVVCGLHSPVVGETEVFGQFKQFWQGSEFSYPLKQILDNIIIDVKKIRGQFLKDLGGQSYGSLIRKMLKSPVQVAMVGSGAFTQDILPWIYKDENQILIHARNLSKAQNLKMKYPKVEIVPIDGNMITAPVVIIAAPLSAAKIQSLVVNKEALVIDLRGESGIDRCSGFKNYKDLAEFFKTIEKNQSKITQAKSLALQAIQEMSQQRFFTESLRPFGWDDICVW